MLHFLLMAIDFAESLKGAKEGSPVKQGFVGWCYLYGRYVEVDYQQAFRWLSAAAEQRASRPFIHLGRMYAEGLGMPQDVLEAIRRYRAVEKVEPRAQLGLAQIYAQGNGIPADPIEALRLYTAVAACDYVHPDPATAAFAGALTPEEIEEAKVYVAKNRG
jgi:TPR repeat protein